MGRNTLRYSIFTPELIAEIRMRVEADAYQHRIEADEYQHRIAADLGCNQGRISEIKNNADWVIRKEEHGRN